MYKQNLHTHSVLCDGKDTLEQLIKKAIELNFDSLGFSTHTRLPFPTDYPLPPTDYREYKKEVDLLKEKYKGIIDLYAGLEIDYLSQIDLNGYDYIIGSVHYLKIGNDYVGFDRSADVVENIINKYYNGNGINFAKDYYQTLAKMANNVKIDIVGHFDLITKNIEIKKLFDTEDKAYRDYALESLRAVCEKVKIFEVNTGAMARGYRNTPYPMPFLLKELKTLGGQITISSDCHDKNYLDFAYDDTIQYVKSCGFDKIAIFKDGEFILEKI